MAVSPTLTEPPFTIEAQYDSGRGPDLHPRHTLWFIVLHRGLRGDAVDLELNFFFAQAFDLTFEDTELGQSLLLLVVGTHRGDVA